MQNLFLGNAKYVFKLSVKKYLLRKKEVGILERKIHSLEEEMDSCPPPQTKKLHQTIVVTQHHSGKMDADIFLVLLKRSASRKTPKLLAEICSCFPLIRLLQIHSNMGTTVEIIPGFKPDVGPKFR